MARTKARGLIAGLAAALTLPLASLALVVGPAAPLADASSHREAPMISNDPAADSTDLYMFTSPENNGTVTFVANYYPFEDPFAGPNFYRFGDNVLYAINVDNNGDNRADITYEFRFRTTVRNPNTFLYNTGPVTSLDDPDLNVYQTYTVTRIDGSGRRDIATDLPVPPVNIGPKSTPNYTEVAGAAIRPISSGGQVFAGQRADPFFVDVAALFDLLTIRKLPGNEGGGINALNNKNVQSIVLQVPNSQLTANGQPVTTGDLGNSNAVIGAWQTASRQKTQVLNPGAAPTDSGEWVQVSRVGNPLVNEVVIPLAVKDAFNAIRPDQDIGAGALPLVQDPEPSRLLRQLYNVNVPPAPRDDLVAVFLTGIPGSVLGLPGATAPMNVPAGASTAAEMMRLNLATPPTAIGGGNRLGVVGGDIAGFPNGRRLTDDVVDIALQALAGATFPLVDKTFTPDPLAGQLGDGVDGPDPEAPLLGTFPYLAIPHRSFDYNTAATPGFIRCASGRVFQLNADMSLGGYVTFPSGIGNNAILQASPSVSAEAIKLICRDN